MNREDLFIVTKLYPEDMGYEKTLKAFAKSCERLQVDYVGKTRQAKILLIENNCQILIQFFSKKLRFIFDSFSGLAEFEFIKSRRRRRRTTTVRESSRDALGDVACSRETLQRRQMQVDRREQLHEETSRRDRRGQHELAHGESVRVSRLL